MNKIMKKGLFQILSTVVLILLASISDLQAQCAMCAAQLESNASSGNGSNTGINSGILYLMIFPYILIAGIAYLWYRTNKKNKQKTAGL